MATTNTSTSWYWYIRKKGKNWVLGLIDENGTAPASALDIVYWYDEIPDEVSDADDLPIPVEFQHAIIAGVVEDAKRMLGERNMGTRRRSKLGNIVNPWRADYEDGIYEGRHRQTEETQQPLAISPYDLRIDDGAVIGTKTPRTA